MVKFLFSLYESDLRVGLPPRFGDSTVTENVIYFTGLVTSDRQVRVLLRDITGKACWDASALYYDPSVTCTEVVEPLPIPKLYVLIFSLSLYFQLNTYINMYSLGTE